MSNNFSHYDDDDTSKYNMTISQTMQFTYFSKFNFFLVADFQLRRNIKSWSQISQAVRDSRKKFNDVCPSLPFNFNFYYPCDDKVRIYFLSSHNSPETTLFYCDVHLVNQSYLELNNSCLYNKSSSAQENMNEIFDTDENLDDKISIENNHQLEMGNGDLESDDYDIGLVGFLFLFFA